MSTSQELRVEAAAMHGLEMGRIEELHELAIKLAPGFRDKFDLSDPKKNFADWADLAWQGAEAFLERKIQATRTASKEREKANDKADQAQLREQNEAKLKEAK